MDKNLNIPKAPPIVQGKVLQKIPEPARSIVGNILNPPSPQDIIKQFLYRPPQKADAVPGKELTMPAVPAKMQSFGQSTMTGGDIYHRLEISAKSFTLFNSKLAGYPDMVFDNVLISCRQYKNVIETPIQGSEEGSVFEYSGLNNYEIEFRILITKNQNGIYPQDDVENLIKMCEAQVSVKVDSWYLQMMSIYEVVLLDYDISQIPGSISQQEVIIHAKSNKRSTLIIQ